MTPATTVGSFKGAVASPLTGGYAVKMSAGIVVAVTAITDEACGIASRDFTADDLGGDDAVGVVLAGPHQGLAGATITRGQHLSFNASGALIPKAGAGWVVAQAMEDASAGQYFAINVHVRKEPA